MLLLVLRVAVQVPVLLLKAVVLLLLDSDFVHHLLHLHLNLLFVDLFESFALLVLHSLAGCKVFPEFVVVVDELDQFVLELLMVHTLHALRHRHLASLRGIRVYLQYLLVQLRYDLVSLKHHLLVDLQLLLCLVRHPYRAVQVRVKTLLLPARLDALHQLNHLHFEPPVGLLKHSDLRIVNFRDLVVYNFEIVLHYLRIQFIDVQTWHLFVVA